MRHQDVVLALLPSVPPFPWRPVVTLIVGEMQSLSQFLPPALLSAAGVVRALGPRVRGWFWKVLVTPAGCSLKNLVRKMQCIP